MALVPYASAQQGKLQSYHIIGSLSNGSYRRVAAGEQIAIENLNV